MMKLGTIAMLTLLISGPALAEQSHRIKQDVEKVLFTKSNEIIFQLKDDSVYRGDIMRSNRCDFTRKQHYTYVFEDKIHDSFRVEHSEGFSTCTFRNLERLA
jgi:hypothetical protein